MEDLYYLTAPLHTGVCSLCRAVRHVRGPLPRASAVQAGRGPFPGGPPLRIYSRFVIPAGAMQLWLRLWPFLCFAVFCEGLRVLCFPPGAGSTFRFVCFLLCFPPGAGSTWRFVLPTEGGEHSPVVLFTCLAARGLGGSSSGVCDLPPHDFHSHGTLRGAGPLT